MGFNKKVLSKAVSELGKAKAPGKPKDIITDPAGQWKYPGQKTRIPSNDITMQGVPYPVWAQPNVGPGSMMQPNQDYNFPGASYVDETPMAKKGGTLQSKKYSKSMSATNKLFTKNKLFQNKKSKIFDPNAEFKTGGSKLGTINLNPNPLSHYELNYGFNLPTKENGGEADYEDQDLTDEEIQALKDAGYEIEELPEAQVGGPQNTSGPKNEVEPEAIPVGTKMSPDYDLKRFYTEDPMAAETFMAGKGHATDKYKLPNHPTFSNQSMYNSTDTPGGEWIENEDGAWSFNASQINRSNMSNKDLKSYFDEVEPGNTLNYNPIKKQGGYVQHELVKAQKGKTVKPYYTSDPKEFKYRNKMYADSLSLYNKGQQDKNTYINYLNKNGFDAKNHLERWNTNEWVDTDVHPTIDATYNGILENSGVGFNRDNRGVAHGFTTYPLKNGSFKYVYDESPEGKLLGKRYSVYKKPVQEVIFRANNNTIKKTLTPIPTKVKYANKKKTITNVNAVPEDKVIPQDEITPLDPMSFPQVARPEQQIIPAPPYVKPVHYAGPRHGAWSDGSKGQFPQGLNTSDWERKTKEYQQKQRGAQPIVTRKQGGELDKAQGGKTTYSGPNRGLVGPSTPKTNGAPTIANAKILEAERKKAALAKQQALAKQKEDELMRGMPKTQVSDNTRTVIPKQVVNDINNAAFYNSPQETANREARKKEQAAFEKEQWNKYNKMSFAEKALDRTQAAIAHPILMAGNALAGNQGYIPGMGRGLMNTESPEYDKYLKATGQTKGQFEISDLANIVNPGHWGGHAGNELHKGNYGTGLLEAGLAFTGVPGSSRTAVQGVKSLAQDINQGGKYLNKTLGTEVPKQLPGSPNAGIGKFNAKELSGSTSLAPVRSGLGGMDMTKYEIKNPDYYTQLLDTYDSKALSSTNKKFYKDLIGSIKNQNGLVTERQFNELQRLKSGNFNFGKKAYEDGGATESWEDDLTDDEINALEAAGFIVEDVNSYQVGGGVSDTWEKVTGTSWDTAKQKGYTSGSYNDNINLLKQLNEGKFNSINKTIQPVINEKKVIKVPAEINTQIKTAKSFNEAFGIARNTMGPNQIFEYNGRKYGTNQAGETFKPSEEVLKASGLNSTKVKERLNKQNTDLNSPYLNKKTVKLQPDEYISWDKVKTKNIEINKNDNAQKIIDYNKNRNSTKNYVIVDKKKGLMHIYAPGNSKPLFSSAVDLGESRSDAQTTTKVKDTNGDGIIDKKEAQIGKADFSKGNKSTGAGKYYISNIDAKGYEGLPLFNMMSEAQYDAYLKTGKIDNVATSFHKGYVADDVNRVSNGCVRCNKTTLDNLTKYLKNSSEVYILPEDDNNNFVYENGKLNFQAKHKTNLYTYKNNGNIYKKENNVWYVAPKVGSTFKQITDPVRVKSLNTGATSAGYNFYEDSHKIVQQGQGVNKSTNTLNYIPIKTTLDEATFKKNNYKDSTTDNEKLIDNSKLLNVKTYVDALATNKQKIMKATKINGDVYNELAKMSFGILGTESNYADIHTPAGNFGRAIGKYFDPKSSSSPDYYSKYYTYGVTDNSNSVGLTQIRWSYLNASEKAALKELGITSNKDFMDPKKAAIGTTAILAIRYNEQLNNTQKQDMWKYLPTKWNTRDNYASRVKNNSRYMSIAEQNKNN